MNFKNLAMWAVIVILTIGGYITCSKTHKMQIKIINYFFRIFETSRKWKSS